MRAIISLGRAIGRPGKPQATGPRLEGVPDSAYAPIALDAPDDRDPPAPHLRVEERVDDVDRDLVAELGAPLRVADDQDVRHPNEPRRTFVRRGATGLHG